VSPEIVDGLGYKGALKRYTCDVSFHFEARLPISAMEGLLGAVEAQVAKAVDRSVREADSKLDAATGALFVPGLRGSAARNAIIVRRHEGGAMVDLQVRTEAAVYLPPKQERDVVGVLRQEIQDDIVYLLWHGLDPKALAGPVVDLDANLGSLLVQETNPLPRKLYKPSKRALVVKRGPAT